MFLTTTRANQSLCVWSRGNVEACVCVVTICMWVHLLFSQASSGGGGGTAASAVSEL